MNKVIIRRYKVTNDYALGFCFIEASGGRVDYVGVSLERGWRNNENNVSCVPEGIYDLKLEHSPKFNKDLWELYGVVNRRECKFHAANYWKQLNGCIALGVSHVDIDGDGDLDVTSSKATMKKFHKLMTGTTAKVEIKKL